MEEDIFNAVFMDTKGKIHSLPTDGEHVGLLVGMLTIDEGWDFLGLEPSDLEEFLDEDGEENSGTEGESAG